MLSVIPFECQKSSLAAALGKLKQTSQSGKDFSVEIWTICPILSYSDIYGMKKNMSNDLLPYIQQNPNHADLCLPGPPRLIVMSHRQQKSRAECQPEM